MKTRALERLLAKIEIGEEFDGERCWLFVGALVDGYGQIWDGSRVLYAHRVAYEELVGPIPDGLQLDHLCRVRRCVNPAHLEPVTGRVNILRGQSPSARNATRTRCPLGHRLVAGNLRAAQGRRQCLTCHRARNAIYRAANRERINAAQRSRRRLGSP